MKFQYMFLISCLFVAAQGIEAAAHKAEDKANELVKQFLNLKNHDTLSWKCFSQEMSHILEKEAKYKPIAKLLHQLSASTDGTAIGKQLGNHQGTLPKSTSALLGKYSSMTLLSIINKRIALNKAGACSYAAGSDVEDEL